MYASPEAIEDLLELQQCLLVRTRAQSKLKELPQRQEILALREKKAQIQAKAAQIDALLSDARQKISRISDDDERMAARQKEKQQEIERAAGNFRAVENLSKELDTIAKKRAALSEKNDAEVAQLEKIQAVHAQVEDALRALGAKEAKAIASFQEEGGDLQREIAQQNAIIEHLSQRIPADVLAQFNKVAERSGGVALGKYVDGRCGCCRCTIDSARLAQLKSQAPLAICPSCKRLLVV